MERGAFTMATTEKYIITPVFYMVPSYNALFFKGK